MKNNLYLKASSLIETVIAISIITICSLIGTLVFTNVINQTPPVKKYEYKFELNLLLEKTIAEKDLTPFKRNYGDFSIEKKVFPHVNNKNLKNVLFIVSLKNKKIGYPLLIIDTNSDEEG